MHEKKGEILLSLKSYYCVLGVKAIKLRNDNQFDIIAEFVSVENVFSRLRSSN